VAAVEGDTIREAWVAKPICRCLPRHHARRRHSALAARCPLGGARRAKTGLPGDSVLAMPPVPGILLHRGK
jgi:hypothetical protein